MENEYRYVSTRAMRPSTKPQTSPEHSQHLKYWALFVAASQILRPTCF